MSDERWAEIPGFGGRYEASDRGRVRSWTHHGSRRSVPKVLRLRSNWAGYQRVRIFTTDSAPLDLSVHRAVLLAFVGLCPEGCEARHLDGNRANNALVNLCWGTKRENFNDQRIHGSAVRGERAGSAKLTDAIAVEIRRRHAEGEAVRALAREFGVSQPAVQKIVKGQSYRHLLDGTAARA